MKIGNYKELIVWQKAKELCVEIYRTTDQFPKEEIYGLSAQMRRAAVSIPSNIAEGNFRGSSKELKQFLLIALGSAGELDAQIEIASSLPKTKDVDFKKAKALLEEVQKMLNKMTRTLDNAESL